MIDLVLYDFYGVSLGCRLGVTECDGTWLMVGTLLGDGEGFGDSVGRDCGGTLVGASDSVVGCSQDNTAQLRRFVSQSKLQKCFERANAIGQRIHQNVVCV